jgi:16S rRNA (guanine527-N7)-methyltransferase
VTSVPPGEAVRRHFAESLEVLRLVRQQCDGATLVDVGSGGGFPGLVIAIVEPATAVHLVEPLKKRATLLAEMAAALGLGNVTVHPVRAEEAGRGPLRESAAIVTARALAPLPEALEYTVPLAGVGGLVALPRGSSLQGELRAAANALRELACRPLAPLAMRPAASATPWLLMVRKGGHTPSRYPRRAGVPGKRPL